ncbi:Ppx/GppA phosphatase family protein [Sulfurimonas diazotrophicus]|uniref:Ppx/GppA phosphatase family protein n=1 Tax=Sulfurimonas diazotrophicus TaxID=3131939 RepID=A0ABZ3H9Z2_9BACT
MAKRTAIIDIGSNSVRMVVFEKSSRFAFSLLHESKSRVRISEGAYADEGNLQSAAIDRALEALGEFLSIARAYGSRKLLCVATSAVRDAPNRALFLSRARNELGLQIKVIDGEKEAYLGGVAAANLLPAMSARTIDIGGGSTEYACIASGNVLQSASLNLGTVRLKELFCDRGDLDGARAYIDAQFAAMPPVTSPIVIGIGGTFRALAQIIQKNQGHPMKKLHAFTFGADALMALGKKILAAPDDSALKQLGVKKERYDVIRPGTLILMRFLQHVGCETLVTSGAGVREGLYLTDLLRHNRHRFPAGYNPSLRYLLDCHTIETTFSNQLPTVAMRLFDLLQAPMHLPDKTRRLLKIAAQLAKVGASVHFYSYHKNSQYLVESALEYGYSHEEIMTVAALVRYHKTRKIAKPFYSDYQRLLPKAKILNRLNLLLALSDALLTHRPRNIDFELTLDDTGVLHVRAKEGSSLYLAKEQIARLGIEKELTVQIA